VGFDYHGGSIDWAREAVKREGLGDRVTFRRAAETPFNLVFEARA
jgi:hypothetical protein